MRKKILEISKLLQIQELEIATTATKDIIGILLIAINDWPNAIDNLNDYESEVRNFIGGDITKKRMEACLSQIDFSENTWEAESLTQLADVFQFYNEDVSLMEIINDLQLKLESEKLID